MNWYALLFTALLASPAASENSHPETPSKLYEALERFALSEQYLHAKGTLLQQQLQNAQIQTQLSELTGVTQHWVPGLRSITGPTEEPLLTIQYPDNRIIKTTMRELGEEFHWDKGSISTSLCGRNIVLLPTPQKVTCP
ncbi:MAG: hypothetical protein ACPGJH_01470 [Alphaproteobacteria bacterium]